MTGIYTARQIKIQGIVQGVGFRPFIYQLARRHDLAGTVANTSSGVIIHVEGPAGQIASFEKDIFACKPPLAHITDISGHDVSVKGHDGFLIIQSDGPAQRATLISPDISICGDCLRELFDPADRRFGYPFINCTNCGPRYTIIDDIPYDRPHTAMKHFPLCGKCRAEYDDPDNRRFHAQPNACPACGPHVTLFDNREQEISSADPLRAAAGFLKQGLIVAVKGLGGFHLAVDAENDGAVKRLRQRKHREEKPFALMSIDREQIHRYAHMAPEEAAQLTSPQRPIVLLKKLAGHPIGEAVAPGNRYFGVMLPYTPLHYRLLSHGFTALVMTSGNLSEEPIAIDNADAFARLADIADYFLVHNRDIYLRSDDSIVRHTAGSAQFIRRSRGYVPIPVFLNHPGPPVLACGAALKNTICLTRGNEAFVSQHIGDLENLRTLEFFKQTIAHLKRILDIRPEAIAHDLHPDYLSTRYALSLTEGIQKIPVQHHHAHIVSAMAEHRLDGDVIGLAFDGTGYGTDGTIWGGEVLVAGTRTFTRAAHLTPLPMPGGEAAIRAPWRMAVSYLADAFGSGFTQRKLPVLAGIAVPDIDFVIEMMAKQINSPLASSLGRLFDGAAALVGIDHRVSFEGQAAMALEMLADDTADPLTFGPVYPFEWTAENPVEIPVRPIIKGIVNDILEKRSPAEIATRFHMTLIRLFSDLCGHLRKETGLDRVVLSGGVFQNAILLNGFIRMLEKRGFRVFAQRLVPANDGGISLGQAVVAGSIVKDSGGGG